MTPKLRQDYLRALDIPAFLYVENSNIVETFEPIECLVIEALEDHSFCQPGQSYDLLEKMLGAIGLSMTSVKCVSTTQSALTSVIESNPAKVILIMNKALKSTLGCVFTAYHPHEILINPALKREAWEVLKEMKVCLK